jgi:uncharacterized membrane protein YdbT with pleckstrin-like domain
MDELDDFSVLCQAIRRTPAIVGGLFLFFMLTVFAFKEMPLIGIAVAFMVVLIVKEIINWERKREVIP